MSIRRRCSTKAAIESADLVRYALVHEPGGSWPTLSEMTQDNADATRWYQLAFDGNVIDTGFEYAVVLDFECSPNRGIEVSPPLDDKTLGRDRSPGTRRGRHLNSADVLNSRVEECRRVHDRPPSIIAVNFWERGDLLAVVDELNTSG